MNKHKPFMFNEHSNPWLSSCSSSWEVSSPSEHLLTFHHVGHICTNTPAPSPAWPSLTLSVRGDCPPPLNDSPSAHYTAVISYNPTKVGDRFNEEERVQENKRGVGTKEKEYSVCAERRQKNNRK